MSEHELPEAKEIKELEEHSQHPDSRRIGLLISILAIVLAICGAMNRKAENAVIVSVVHSSDSWAYFQAKKLRGYQSETTADLARVLTQGGNATSQGAAQKISARYEEKQHKYEEDAEKASREAEAHTLSAEKWEARASRLSLGEIFLQIALVLCSIAILTRSRAFVYGGLGFAAIGIGCAVSSLLLY